MRLRLLLIAGATICAAPAGAAMTVIGSGYARSCFLAAETHRTKPADVALCTTALTEEGLTPRDRAATFVNRGILMMYNKNVAKALLDYEAAIRIKPDVAEAWVNKGIALIYLPGRALDAVAALSKGIDLKTSQPEVAHFSRALAYELAGDAKGAYLDYKQALQLKPGWPEALEQIERFQVVQKKDG